MTTWRGMFLDMQAAYGKHNIKLHRPNADGVGFQVYRKIDFLNLTWVSFHYSYFTGDNP